MRSVRATGAQVASQGCRPSISRWGQRSPSPPRSACRPSSPPPGAPRPPPPFPLPGGPIAAAAGLGAVGPAAPGLQVGAGLREGLGPVARSDCSVCICASGSSGCRDAFNGSRVCFFPSFLPPPRGVADSINRLFKEIVRIIIMALLRFLKDVALYGGVIHRCNTYCVS